MLSRGKIGNKGGGRPRDVVREKLTKLAQGKGLRFLNKLMDGKVEVQLVGECPHCHETADVDARWVESVVNLLSTSVDQRLKGLEQAFKYGIGTKDETDIQGHPDVQKFISVHAQATREIVGDEMFLKIAERIKELAA